ncbi:MAG TPA: hypothetical protein VFJ74_11785 [Gemmatimonadaceae bacterium]|nr:hypothetical protein [Gemmatimonadaceae bacterium]
MRLLQILTPAYIAFSALVLLWDVFLAGQIAQLRRVPPTLRSITALAGLLLAPGLAVELAAGSLVTARTIVFVTWVWPLALVLFAVQAVYATARRVVAPIIGVPIAVYDVLLAAAALVRFAGGLGLAAPSTLLALTAAQAATLGLVTGAAALSSPYVLAIPMLAPAYPARWRFSKTLRAGLALAAGVFGALTLVEVPPSVRAVGSYARYATERMRERPAGDFVIGLKILPDLDGPPPPLALRSDLDLVDSLEVDAVMATVNPDGARVPALDSLARSLDELRRDTTLLIVTLGYGHDDREQLARDPRAYFAARVGQVRRVVARLHPDYLLPADEPYGRGALALGRRLPPAMWEDYLTLAARATRRIDPRVRIGVAAAAYDARDSALYAWAAAPGSPVDAVGFTIYPSFRGGFALESRTRAADRWMHALPPVAAGGRAKEQWVFSAGGYPSAHGEASQSRAVWGALVWATSHPEIRGIVVADASDYDAATGLRAPDGRMRPAAAVVLRATLGLREAATAAADASAAAAAAAASAATTPTPATPPNP